MSTQSQPPRLTREAPGHGPPRGAPRANADGAAAPGDPCAHPARPRDTEAATRPAPQHPTRA
eukprot:2907995-Alexandrium_andersonii.AAC.1